MPDLNQNADIEPSRDEIKAMAYEICSFRGETPWAVDRGGVEKWEDYIPLSKAVWTEFRRLMTLRRARTALNTLEAENG